MYLVATMHLGRFSLSTCFNVARLNRSPSVFAGFRFYKSVFLDPKGPISYLRNPFHWEFLGLIILLCIQTWLGDALAVSGTVLSDYGREFNVRATRSLDIPVLFRMEQQSLAHLDSRLLIARSNW